MDKQKSLGILGLAPSASSTDARKAFRRLAKLWHPDRFAKDPWKAKMAEEKMKQVNAAFHFLLPLLPDCVEAQGTGQSPLDGSRDCGLGHGRAKRSQGFFASLIAGFRKRLNRGRGATVQGRGCVGQPGKSGPHGRAKNGGIQGKTQFETIFQNTVNHHRAGTNLKFHPKTRPFDRYADYRKYVAPAPDRLRNMRYMKKRGVGPVEEIKPISPVSPVGRDQ